MGRIGYTVESPAKVNFTLDMVGRRVDGYHLLRSEVVTVSLFDTVSAVEGEAGAGFSVATEFEGIPRADLEVLPAERHLAVRAARALADAAGVAAPAVDFRIVKRIPVGAGMGGGSADAAGALVALNELWGLGWPRERLAQVGIRAGCDVPALTLGGAVLMEGVGERVSPLKGLERRFLVSVFPGIHISTREVYEKYDESFLTPAVEIYDNSGSATNCGDSNHSACTLRNGLQDTVFRLYPDVKRCYDALLAAGASQCLLSGSGSSVFGLADSEEQARGIQSRLDGIAWSRVLETLPDCVMVAHRFLVP